ncbi:MAG: hypothetical protein LBH00_09525 [Planctomycetaceae bacterium]|nr:hypothetical protein [Planctomycetaceae bacterium]
MRMHESEDEYTERFHSRLCRETLIRKYAESSADIIGYSPSSEKNVIT